MRSLVFALLGLCALLSVNAHAQTHVSIESGMAFPGYNNVRIPNETGTLFSLTNDLAADPVVFWRFESFLRLNENQEIGAVIAPLRIKATGSLGFPVRFEQDVFQAGNDLTATYRFDSYRLTWRYRVLFNDRWTVKLGVTGKIRDAAVGLESAQKSQEKTNTGFVPLIHALIDYNFSSRITARLQTDALAASQGRAEDVFVGILARIRPAVQLKAGYRLLEGGADVDEVYNFALVHYAAFGFIWSF